MLAKSLKKGSNCDAPLEGSSMPPFEDDPKTLVLSLRDKYMLDKGSGSRKSTTGMVLESTLEIKSIVPGGPLDRDFDGVHVEEGDQVWPRHSHLFLFIKILLLYSMIL